MEHPHEFTDTDPRALQVWLELLRSKTQQERLDSTLDLSNLALRIAENGVRGAHPRANNREVFLRAAARRLPRELMIRAYGWDPREHGHTG